MTAPPAGQPQTRRSPLLAAPGLSADCDQLVPAHCPMPCTGHALHAVLCCAFTFFQACCDASFLCFVHRAGSESSQQRKSEYSHAAKARTPWEILEILDHELIFNAGEGSTS